MQRLIMIAALLALLFPAESARADSPVLVELFTSQGCNSCPPADAYLGDLAKRKDVIALAFHVDYWDQLGWKDPFAKAAWTQRQRAYQSALRTSTIYTPQMVVDGGDHAVGSDRRAVEALIGKAAKGGRPSLAAKATADGLSLTIAGEGNAEIWIVGHDPRHETRVARGENAGKTLAEFNIVRGIAKLAAWKGGAVTLTVPKAELPEGGAFVALLQESGQGRVLATAAVAN
jgi:hypothetical protein